MTAPRCATIEPAWVDEVDIAEYLRRISYRGPTIPNTDTLRQLQGAHLLAVPFENLSIHWHEPIVLDDAALYDKIVVGRRGGFCYELNGLFAALLRALGFQVDMLSAGVMGASGAFGADFDHMTLLVTLDERWLVDVGFGDSFVEPLRLDEEAAQVQERGAYRLDRDAESFALMRNNDGVWRAQYRFTLRPHQYGDYAAMCLYHQTSPRSHFTKQPMCSRLTAGGRVTVSGRQLIRTTGSERREQALAGESEFADALLEHFGILTPQTHECLPPPG